MIKLNDEEIQHLRRVAKSVNQKIRRASKRGEKDLPDYMSVRDLRAQFTTKEDLKNEISQFEKMLNNKEALRRRATKEGTISNWRFEYIQDNLQATREHIDREIKRQKIILKDYDQENYFAINEKIYKMEQERDIINQELDKLTAQELRSAGKVVDRYKRRMLKTIAGRKYFMRNLDALLHAQGKSAKEREKIYRKLNRLTNEEFEEMYERHDIISSIMVSIDSLDDDELTNEERFERAEKALEDENVLKELELFESDVGDYIKEAKQVVKDNQLLFDASQQQYVTFDEYEKQALDLGKRKKNIKRLNYKR